MKPINPITETRDKPKEKAKNKVQFHCQQKHQKIDNHIKKDKTKSFQIIKRIPIPFFDPVTIEYHFKDRKQAEEFKLPLKYKEKYYLLSEIFERIRPKGSYKKNCPAISWYRIIQFKT